MFQVERWPKTYGLRVLLVESNEAFLQAAAEFLERYPELAVVSTAYSAKLLTLARDMGAQVILLDLDMPDLASLEAIRGLHHSLPEAAIIALTSLDGHAPLKAAHAAGALEVVRKAALTTDLLPAIQRVIPSASPA